MRLKLFRTALSEDSIIGERIYIPREEGKLDLRIARPGLVVAYDFKKGMEHHGKPNRLDGTLLTERLGILTYTPTTIQELIDLGFISKSNHISAYDALDLFDQFENKLRNIPENADNGFYVVKTDKVVKIKAQGGLGEKVKDFVDSLTPEPEPVPIKTVIPSSRR